MVAELNSADICNDWLSLGFNHPPFSCNSQSTHFRSQNFITSLNKLLTLDTTNVCLALLQGENGSGKSTCLKTFSKSESLFKNIYLSASSGLTPINLLKVLCQSAAVSLPIKRNPSPEYCINLLKALQQAKTKTRLIIDDAQNTPASTLVLIESLAQLQPTGNSLQFLMCSNRPLRSIFPEKVWGAHTIQTINMGALSFEETKRYIALRLNRAQSEEGLISVPESILQKVHLLSKGNILRINNLAAIHICNHIATANKERQQTFLPQTNSKKNITTALLILPVILLQICFSYRIQMPLSLFNQAQYSHRADQPPKTLALPQRLQRNRAQQTLATLKKGSPKVLTHSVINAKTTAAKLATTATGLNATTNQHTPVAISHKQVQNNEESKVKPKSVTVASSATTTKPTIFYPKKAQALPLRITKPLKHSMVSSPAKIRSAVISASIYRPKPRQHITVFSQEKPAAPTQTTGWYIQLGAFARTEQAQRFIQENKLNQPEIQVQHALRRNKAMYLVLAGPFLNQQQLSTFKKSHTHRLTQLNGWVRRASIIAKELIAK